MKLRGKLSKLTQPVAYRRGWRRAQRYIFRLTLGPLRADIDQATQRLWGPAEWDFLLRDLQQHLRPGGKLFFGLNPSSGGEYYKPELRDFFVSRGAHVERERILFDKGLRF